MENPPIQSLCDQNQTNLLTCSPPAMPHHLQNPKWPQEATKWPTRSENRSNPRLLGVLNKT